MKCPICYYQDTKVSDSRALSDGFSVRRRRECLECGFRFSTYEQIEILDLSVIKKNNSKQAYSREKLIKGIRSAFEKRSIDKDKFNQLVFAIERTIQSYKKSEISSIEIGHIILEHLKKFDQVAYIRFASIHECFSSIEEFKKKLQELK